MNKNRMLAIIIIVFSLIGISVLTLISIDNNKKRYEVNPNYENMIEFKEGMIIIKPDEIGTLNIADIFLDFNSLIEVEENGVIKEDGKLLISGHNQPDYKVIINGKAYEVNINLDNLVLVYDSDVFIGGYNKSDAILKNYPRILYTDNTYQQVADLSNITQQRLYVKPDEYIYTVSYVVDSKVIEIYQVALNEKAPFLEVPEKIGYTRIGWEDQTGLMFDHSQSITENMTLIAVYERNTYMIDVYEIDDHGDEQLVSTHQYLYGEKVNLSFVDKDDWNIFGGIYLAYDKDTDTYDEALDIGADLEVTGNLKLYVKYTYFPHIQYFDGDKLILREYYDATLVIVPKVSKAGYQIIGWYLEPELLNEYDFGPTAPPNMKLYAKWGLIQYLIVYELDGGTTSNPTTYTTEDEIILEDAVKEGYEFKGWFDQDEKQVTVINRGTNGDINLTARYEKIVLTITIHLPDGSTSEVTLEYGDKLPMPDAVSKAGYSFDGWVDENDNPFDFDAPITSADVILKPKFNINTYTISYDTGGGTNDESNPTSYDIETPNITLASPNRLGYTFIRWLDDHNQMITEINTGSFGDITLKAEWAIILYSITYELDGGLNDDHNPANYTIASETITLYAPTKEGYNFIGWDDPTGNRFTEITTGTVGDLSLEAKFEATIYTIIYNLDDGTNHADNLDAYTIESGEMILEPASKSGYRFVGWLDENDQVITSIAAGTIGNRELKAEFIKQVTVSFNSGTQKVEDVVIDIDTKIQTETKTVIEEKLINENYVPSNHRISYWTVNDSFFSFEEAISDDLNLYVVYTVITTSLNITEDMTKVYWVDGQEIREDASNFNQLLWFDYSNQEWANMVTPDGSYWVWIPRFSYVMIQRTTTGNTAGTIEVRFSTSDGDGGFIDDTTDGYVVHPAFTYPENVGGIWIAKFETSKNNDQLLSIPGEASYRQVTMNIFVQEIIAMRAASQWQRNHIDLTITNLFHWEAAAFLGHSIYGTNGNPITSSGSNYQTGGGAGNAYLDSASQSNTGNVTGVYDMVGGVNEYQITHTDGTTNTRINLLNDSYMGRYVGSPSSVSPNYFNHSINVYRGWFNAANGTSFGDGSFYSKPTTFAYYRNNGDSGAAFGYRLAIIENKESD